MGAKQSKKGKGDMIDQWIDHIEKRSDQMDEQRQYYQKFNPKDSVKLIITELEKRKEKYLNSYSVPLIEFLKEQDPNQYVGALAIQLFLGQNTIFYDFKIPQAKNRAEQELFIQIARDGLINETASRWGEIFSEKYRIFVEKNTLKQDLIRIIEHREFIYNSMCQDILHFKDFLESIASQIFEAKSSENLEKLVIKIILQKKQVRELINKLFSIYCLESTSKLKQKIQQNKSITLGQLNVNPLIHSVEFPQTLSVLKQIINKCNPCDKFECFDQLDNALMKDLEALEALVQGGIEIMIDDQIGIFIFLIIQLGSNHWPTVLTFIEKFLGQGINYQMGQQSQKFITIKNAVNYILENL